MKKTIFALTCLVGLAFSLTSLSAAAALNGPYIGAGLGWTNQDAGAGDVDPFSSGTDHSGVGKQLQLGWQVMRLFALQTDYTVYDANFLDSEFQNTWDLRGNAMLPLGRKIKLLGGVGAAYVDQDGAKANTAFRPEYDLGVQYKITHTLTSSLVWTRIIGSDSSVNDSNAVIWDLALHL